MGLTHIFKSHFQFITSVPPWRASKVGFFPSGNTPRSGLRWILSATTHCVKVSPGTSCSSTIVFWWVACPLSVTMATSRLQEKEKARESTLETLSTRQDNLLGRSLWPLLWHYMERQLVVLGLPDTHISCPAFVLLLSRSCLIIYTHAMIIYQINYFTNRGRRRQPERGMEGEQRVHKNGSMVSFHYINIFPVM